VARLIDEILSDRRVLVSGEWLKPGQDLLLESARPVVADEISQEYYGPNYDPHYVLDCQNDLGPLHLPYPTTWIEYRVHPSMAVGFLAVEETRDTGGWHQFWQGYVKGANGRIGRLPDIFQVFLAPNGRVVSARPLVAKGGKYQPKWDEPEQANPDDLGILNVSLLALDILNTTRGYTESVTPPAPLSKKWQKKTGRPLVSYSRIVVPNPSSRSGHGNGEHSGSCALHSVRGHWAQYGSEGKGKLFGKYEGEFWIPSHERGDPSLGQVKSTYVVKPPEAMKNE
jgi:hypothetical protein